ncbi:hypothetical protein [Erwinia sp.]|uniref:hypothetical protein n=1 Tax=Erwinia citreus TaxID=558 RepID=UPI002897B746|nr:hypothetical protein [Erwinia sp.]
MVNSISGAAVRHTDSTLPLPAANTLQEHREHLQRDFAAARTTAYQRHPSGTWALNSELVQARLRFKNQMEQLRAHFNQPLTRVPLDVENCDDSFEPGEFQVLQRCANIIASEVYKDFSEVSLFKDKDNELDEGVRGQTWVLHPNFEDTHQVPYTEQQAQISFGHHQSLSENICVLTHEVLTHLLTNMRAAETGDPQQPEEAGHFDSLSVNSDYHQGMVALENNWEQISSLARQVGEKVSWDEVKSEYLDDVGLQVGSFHTHLNLKFDHMDELLDSWREGKVNMTALSANERAGLKANIFWSKVREAVLDEKPLSAIRE